MRRQAAAGRSAEAAPAKRDTRLELLAAAETCLRTHGHADLSTRSVAEMAGVPLSQIHYHFGSKQGLVLALLDHLNERLLERQSATFAEPHAAMASLGTGLRPPRRGFGVRIRAHSAGHDSRRLVEPRDCRSGAAQSARLVCLADGARQGGRRKVRRPRAIFGQTRSPASLAPPFSAARRCCCSASRARSQSGRPCAASAD